MGWLSKKSSGSRANSIASSDTTIKSNSRKGSSTSITSGSLRNSASKANLSVNSQNYLPMTPSIPQTDLPPPPDPAIDPAGYLRSIHSVRERSRIVLDAARADKLTNFHIDLSKFPDVANYVVSIIKRDYAPDYSSIPPHGRWQHFEVGGVKRVDNLINSWANTDTHEIVRRLLDLFVVSVLLDAGAGNKWQYQSQDNGRIYRRSEGLAVASLDMFKAGLFSSNPNQPEQVDAAGLQRLTLDDLVKGLQVSQQNPIDGLEGRTSLLIKLGEAMKNEMYFGPDGRPGNMLDYLLHHHSTQRLDGTPVIAVPTLWEVLMDGLAPIWPQSRTQLDGISLGDAWPCSSMPPAPGWPRIVPFHKLTQWLAYSLMVPIKKFLGAEFLGEQLMTGLPEYRNGGLFIDLGLMTLKEPQMKRGIEAYHQNSKKAGQPSVEVVPMFTPDDDVIVEWRACTLGFLDLLQPEVNRLLGLEGEEALSLAQMLEAGTWKGGREIAEYSRPNTKQPPIMILSDGTVF